MTITADLDRSTGSGRTRLSNGRHEWFTDLSSATGGQDSAPQPHDLLDSALAACTALTLELYLRRKGWPATSLHVTVEHAEAKGADGVLDYRLSRSITVAGELTAEQREQLLAIANRCPIHRVLEGRIAVTTTIG